MSGSCVCCEGAGSPTPGPTANRPGLAALSYRVGTHASFLETMLARLPAVAVPGGPDGEGPGEVRPLVRLAVRTPDDPVVALLDAWAAVADVLTFYQERIANEGYLRTATERRSLVELARLTGYEPRPGVAAGVHLAFDLEDGYRLELPEGIRAQSIPGPGETMEAFETGERLECRSEWNRLTPRAAEPHRLVPGGDPCELYLQGITTGLGPGDLLLADFVDRQELYRVAAVEPDAPANRTRVALLCRPPTPSPADEDVAAVLRRGAEALLRKTFATGRAVATTMLKDEAARIEGLGRHVPSSEIAATLKVVDDARGVLTGSTSTALRRLDETEAALNRLGSRPASAGADAPRDRTGLGGLLELQGLYRGPSRPPASARHLPRGPEAAFAAGSAAAPALLTALDPRLARTLYQAWGAARVPTGDTPRAVHAFRVKAAPFGATAPRPFPPPIILTEVGIDVVRPSIVGTPNRDWDLEEEASAKGDVLALSLDAVYDRIVPESWVLVAWAGLDEPEVFRAERVETLARASYGITGRVTRLVLDGPWIRRFPGFPREAADGPDLGDLRRATVYAQSEALPLAERPVTADVAGDEIDLDGLYPGLEAGRRIVVAGERTDLPGTSAAELAMIAGVRHAPEQVAAEETTAPLPGDRVHTYLTLAAPLAYSYRRDSVLIYGNVATATHGETREQVLGSGDGSAALQRFGLQQGPLTHVAAPTPRGTRSTLTIRVDGVKWDQAPHLTALAPDSRAYLARTGPDGKAGVVFGDGVRGARLPTGSENVTAVYRTGIGSPGNVAAGRISLLATRPAGLRTVVNPLPSSGGGDPDGPEEIRRNVPLGLLSLERVVSVQDFADFARAFAGIGKAEAAFLTNGRRPVVHLTVAGVGDAPVDRESDLFRALVKALRRYGDPHRHLVVEPRELRLLVAGACVRVDPRRLWEDVEPRVRAALLERFGFARRELGQGVAASEVVSTIQGVRGVEAVDLDYLAAVGEAEIGEGLDALGGLTSTLEPYVPARLARPDSCRPSRMAPAELAVFSPAVPDTLILTEWKR